MIFKRERVKCRMSQRSKKHLLEKEVMMKHMQANVNQLLN